jgi:hypothetical protein
MDEIIPKPEIKFDTLHYGIDCDCLDGANFDTEKEYIRKIKTHTAALNDFDTHWERGMYRDKTACNDVCMVRSVSVNLFKPENLAQIVAKYQTTFTINPKRGAHYIRFKLMKNNAKVKPTPAKDNKSHCSLFKSDVFDFNHLEIIDTVKFA